MGKGVPPRLLTASTTSNASWARATLARASISLRTAVDDSLCVAKTTFGLWVGWRGLRPSASGSTPLPNGYFTSQGRAPNAWDELEPSLAKLAAVEDDHFFTGTRQVGDCRLHRGRPRSGDDQDVALGFK